LVSTIIRSMDRATLREAMAAAAAQDWPRLEIVVVNAKGPGHGPLPAVAATGGGNVSVRFVDQGRALVRGDAANAGLDAAAGELIYFLDDDDVVEPNHVSTLAATLAAHSGAQAAYAGVALEHYSGDQLTRSGVLHDAYEPQRLWGSNYIPIHAVLFRRSLLAAGCRFDPSLPVYEDWDFWIQVSMHTDFVRAEAITARYRGIGDSGVGGVSPDAAQIPTARAALFDKWRLRWTGAQVLGIIEWREALLRQRAEAAQQQHQRDHAQLLELHGTVHQRNLALIESNQALIERDLALGERDRTIGALHETVHQRNLALIEREQTIQQREQALAQASARAETAEHAAAATAHALDHARLEGAEHWQHGQLLLRLLAQQQQQAAALAQQVQAMHQSRSWRLTAPVRGAASAWRKARTARRLVSTWVADHGGGFAAWAALLGPSARLLFQQGPLALARSLRRLQQPPRDLAPPPSEPTPIRRPALVAHTVPVDVIVRVHDGLDDARHCLQSVLRHSAAPLRLIVVDDGSAAPTREFLADFAREHGRSPGCTLIRNERPQGPARAANQGLRAGDAPLAVLLAGDTVVGAQWLDRLVACAESDPRLGLVGPLGNAASWQSIPAAHDPANHPAAPPPPSPPPGFDIDGWAAAVAAHAARAYPRLPLLDGFCLLIKREVITRIGLFDDHHFAHGDGAASDFCLRAAQAGFALAVADDAYVFRTLPGARISDAPDRALVLKHGQALLAAAARLCREDRTMQGLRAHAARLAARPGEVHPLPFDPDLFRPRPRSRARLADADRVHIGAQIALPSQPQAAALTLRVLRWMWGEFGAAVVIELFGTDSAQPPFQALAAGFEWRNHGVLTAERTAAVLNDLDVFVDFSEAPATAVTTLQAMASGASVIVPRAGGACGIARHEDNALIVDTADAHACHAALHRLIVDAPLRLRLQTRGLRDAVAAPGA
jgi:GT2 family glycosyltransferase